MFLLFSFLWTISRKEQDIFKPFILAVQPNTTVTCQNEEGIGLSATTR